MLTSRDQNETEMIASPAESKTRYSNFETRPRRDVCRSQDVIKTSLQA